MIEMGKKYRTRDGRDVRIYAVDAGGESPVHGAINLGDMWRCETWDVDGIRLSMGIQDDWDLIGVLPEMTVRRYLCIDDGNVPELSSAPTGNWKRLGQIDITHDGQNLIRVEIVK